MSYADAAASGPSQSAEEARAPPMPEVQSTTTSSTSLIDVDQPHIETVPPNFPSQSTRTTTQSEQHTRESVDINISDNTNTSSQSSSKSSKGKSSRSGEESTVKKLRENADHPVVLGNAVVSAALMGVLGYSGYRWWSNGAEGGWKVGGAVAVAVGVFVGLDFGVSRWAWERYQSRR